MNNLRKIFGTCKAGCQWETVHRSEFEKSASHILQYPQEDGSYRLEIGKEYKAIDTTHLTVDVFSAKLSVDILMKSGAKETLYILDEPSNPDTFSKSFTFKILGTEAEAIIYEFCGVRYSYNKSGMITIGAVKLEWGGELYLYNADATIKAENGKSAYEIAVEKGYEGTEEEWIESITHGADGTSVTIKSVSESTEDGAENVITFSDGKTLTVRNGHKGEDYVLTEADKTEIAAKVVEMLGGNPVYAVIDENNIVTIKGLSEDESYTFKLEMEDGSAVDVGEFEPMIEPTNFIDTSSADFAINSRISNSGENGISSGTNVSVTNYIKVEKGDIIKLDNCMSNSISNMSVGSRFAVYTGTTHNERIYNGVYSTDNGYVHTLTDNEFEIVGDNFSYVRFTIGDYSDVNQITLHIQRNGKLL